MNSQCVPQNAKVFYAPPPKGNAQILHSRIIPWFTVDLSQERPNLQASILFIAVL